MSHELVTSRLKLFKKRTKITIVLDDTTYLRVIVSTSPSHCFLCKCLCPNNQNVTDHKLHCYCSTSLLRMVDNSYQSVVLTEPRVQHKAVQVKWFKPLWPRDLWIFSRVDRQDCAFPPNNVRAVTISPLPTFLVTLVQTHIKCWLALTAVVAFGAWRLAVIIDYAAAEKYLTLAGQSHYLWWIVWQKHLP